MITFDQSSCYVTLAEVKFFYITLHIFKRWLNVTKRRWDWIPFRFLGLFGSRTVRNEGLKTKSSDTVHPKAANCFIPWQYGCVWPSSFCLIAARWSPQHKSLLITKKEQFVKGEKILKTGVGHNTIRSAVFEFDKHSNQLPYTAFELDKHSNE